MTKYRKQTNLLAHLLVLLLFVVTFVRCGTDWPVFFEHLGKVHSIHNKWDLTFSIDTHFSEFETRLKNVTNRIDAYRPSFPPQDKVESENDAHERDSDEINETDQSDAKELNQESVYLIVNEHWDILSKHLKKRADTLLVRLNDYKSLGDSRTFKDQGRRRRRKTREAADSDESDVPKSREKRQACKKITGLAGYLFGFAYQPNIDCMNEELDRLRKNLHGDVDNLVNSQNSMQQKTSRQIMETKKMVKKVEKMTGKIEEKMTIIERRSSVGKSPTQNLIEKTMLLLQRLDAELRECEQFLSEMERVITSLAGGRLSQSLVSGPKLKRHLRNVERQVPRNFSLLYPSKHSLWPYYSVLSTSIYFSKDFDEIYVHLSIPLVDKSNELGLYRVHNLPLKVRNGYSVTADIDTEYLLTAQNGDFHLPLSKEDFQDCQVYQQKGQQFFCGFGPLLQSKKSSSCVIQLFNVDGGGDMCQSRLTHGLVQPFTRLYNGSWVFAALNQQVPVVMNCPNTTIPTSLLGFGVINLMEGCTLTSEEYLYPHTFAGFSDVSMSFEISDSADKKMDEQVDEDDEDDEDYDDEYEDYEYGLHQINYYDYTDEPLIISAVEAETEDYYDMVSTGTEAYTITSEPDNDYFSEDLTTRVSVETSFDVISNLPDKTEIQDMSDKYDMIIPKPSKSPEEELKDSLVTKDDFVAPQDTNHLDDDSLDMSEEEATTPSTVGNELKILPEDSEEQTEVHHNVLVKLKDKIKNGKHWLDNFSSTFREFRRLLR